MDRGSVVAALAAHYQGGLAGKGREFDLAADPVGDVPRQRGLAGSGIAEQPEHRRRAVPARLGLQPIGDGFERRILMRRKRGHGVSAEGERAVIGRDSLALKLTIRAFHARSLPRRGIDVSWPRLDLPPMGNTLEQNNKRFGSDPMKFGIFYELQL